MGARLSPRKELAPSAQVKSRDNGPMSRDEAMKKVFDYAPPSSRLQTREERNTPNTSIYKV